MSELESEESTAQPGQGVKILSKQQMITRLSVLLAQLQAGNNSQKNEIDNYCIFCTDQKS